MSVIQDLYNDEFSVNVTCVFDLGFAVSLGDALNNNTNIMNCETFKDVEDALILAAIRERPDSDFAKKYSKKFPNIGDKN